MAGLSETAPAEPLGLMSRPLQTAGLEEAGRGAPGARKEPQNPLQEHAKNPRTHALSRFALPTRLQSCASWIAICVTAQQSKIQNQEIEERARGRLDIFPMQGVPFFVCGDIHPRVGWLGKSKLYDFSVQFFFVSPIPFLVLIQVNFGGNFLEGKQRVYVPDHLLNPYSNNHLSFPIPLGKLS